MNASTQSVRIALQDKPKDLTTQSYQDLLRSQMSINDKSRGILHSVPYSPHESGAVMMMDAELFRLQVGELNKRLSRGPDVLMKIEAKSEQEPKGFLYYFGMILLNLMCCWTCFCCCISTRTKRGLFKAVGIIGLLVIGVFIVLFILWKVNVIVLTPSSKGESSMGGNSTITNSTTTSTSTSSSTS